jgi:hypothetical protein
MKVNKKGNCPICNKYKSLHCHNDNWLCSSCYKKQQATIVHDGNIMRKAKVHSNEDLKLYNRRRHKREAKKELDKEV